MILALNEMTVKSILRYPKFITVFQ